MDFGTFLRFRRFFEVLSILPDLLVNIIFLKNAKSCSDRVVSKNTENFEGFAEVVPNGLQDCKQS